MSPGLFLLLPKKSGKSPKSKKLSVVFLIFEGNKTPKNKNPNKATKNLSILVPLCLPPPSAGGFAIGSYLGLGRVPHTPSEIILTTAAETFSSNPAGVSF